MKGTTILRWTGRGSFEPLMASVKRLLENDGAGARVERVGDSILVEGPEPARVAARFAHLPGISWIAVGMSGRSLKELGKNASVLAGRYLKRSARFTVEAESKGPVTPADLSGTVVSAVLGSATGVRTAEGPNAVRFRAAFDGKKGAVGVELLVGVGGAPTSAQGCVCLVSGGKHSSVVAWMALLNGYAVRLVHFRVDGESVKAVARLYAELSNRVDYSKLSLEVWTGDPLLFNEGGKRTNGTPVFTGFHPGCGRLVLGFPGVIQAPLLLLPEEMFGSEFRALAIKGYDSPDDWRPTKAKPRGRTSFGRERADVSGVLDGLR